MFSGVLQDGFPAKIGKLYKETTVWRHILKKSPEIKRLQHRCFPVNFVKLLRTPFFTEHLQWSWSLRLGVHEKVFEWLTVNEFLSNSMEFLHANSKNCLRFSCISISCFYIFSIIIFFLLMKILNISARTKIHSIKLSGSGNQKVFLWICRRNI